jgi:LysM domain
MATAIWDLDRRAASGRVVCPPTPRPAALPLRPDGDREQRRAEAAARRRITFVVALAVAVGLLSTLPSALDLPDLAGPYEPDPRNGGEAGEEVPSIHAVVQPGDTIWDIAAPHVPEGMSLQDYVAEVLLLNDVDPAALEPGSVLDLPQHE